MGCRSALRVAMSGLATSRGHRKAATASQARNHKQLSKSGGDLETSARKRETSALKGPSDRWVAVKAELPRPPTRRTKTRAQEPRLYRACIRAAAITGGRRRACAV